VFEKISRHADLVDKMAESAGVDLGEAVATGALPPSELRSTVRTCTHCRDVAACEAFLAEGGGLARRVPDYCLNKELFERLRP